MQRVFSGIQPTGNVHLGNYLGSIRNWVDLQQEYSCIFGIMNLHAITLPTDPKLLQENSIEAAALYLACGLDAAKSIIFLQSQVSCHAELAWVFSCLTSMGWLNRMTQFKEKSANNQNLGQNLGLYAYPVLMASDILLYKANLVPVGEDQKQHLELTRDIALAFNNNYNSQYFTLPKPLIMPQVKRIMSLQDGTKKMSKSDNSDLSRINLNDPEQLIIKKIKKAKTDSSPEITYDESRCEIYNLLNIFSAFSNESPQDIAKKYCNLGNSKFKNDLSEVIIAKLQPIQNKLQQLLQDKSYITQTLEQGRQQAQEIAFETKQEVFKLVGLK